MTKKISPFIILFAASIMQWHCIEKKPRPSVKESDFYLTPCELKYKGNELPFGKSIQEWFDIFGEDYRRLKIDSSSLYKRFIWDSIGIAVVEEKTEITKGEKLVTKLYIFFSNLDSPAGQAGELKHASDFHIIDVEKYTSIDPEYPDVKPFTLKEVKELQEQLHPKNYIYPYRTYSKVVNVEGAGIEGGMTLKEVNRARKKAGLPIFSFWDLNMDMIPEGGHTKGDKGSYHDESYSIESCKQETDTFTYHISIRYTDDHQPEYLEVTTEVEFGR